MKIKKEEEKKIFHFPRGPQSESFYLTTYTILSKSFFISLFSL